MTDSKAKLPSSKSTLTKEAENKSTEPEIILPIAKKSSGRGISIFAIILSILAIAGSGFTWYQSTVLRVQQESKLAIGVSEIGGKISRLGDSMTRIQQDQVNVVSKSDLSFRVLALKTELDSEIKELVDSQAELSEAVEILNSDLKKGLNQYVLDEVAQLLQLANNRVLFGGSGDVGSAINALRLADTHLKSLNDSRFTEVRTKINREIALLGDVNIIDIEETSLILNAISATIHLLPLANEPVQQAIARTDESNNEAITWRTELKKFWQDILSSVSIQRVDQPPKPLLVPEQRYFLEQNLQLRLARAEFALIQGEEKVFLRNIKESVKWLEEYFDTADSKVNAALNQLKVISAQPLSSELPSISGSTQALHTITGG